MEAVNNMNGTIWIFASILICWVLVQSFLFLRHTLRFNKKHNLVSKEEQNSAIRVGAVASIGPAMNSVVVALSLIAMVGSATTFMRCGVIGAPSWELFMAQIAASVAGVSFGTPEFTESVFTMCIFCMVLASAPYFINTMVMLKPLDTMVEKSKASKKKVSFMPYLSGSAMFALLTYTLPGLLLVGLPSLAAIICSVVAALIWDKLSKKMNSAMMGSFNMGVAMVFGMAGGQICAMLTA